MAALLDRLAKLRGGGGGGAYGAGGVFVGAFGKHPAWDDHIFPAIGLEGRLTRVMETLYFGGVQKSIAHWREAAEADLIPFGHLFVWQTPYDVVVGRLWHSSDGKSRSDYPMVVCAQCPRVPVGWALERLAPVLERVERQCKGATERAEVESVIHAARAEIRQAMSGADEPADPAAASRAVVQLAADDGVGPEGLRRAVYVLYEAREAHPRQARVPGGSTGDVVAVRTWCDFLDARFDSELSRFVIAPEAGDWVDLVLGSPDGADFRVLRYATSLAPLETQTPYSLSDGFIREVDEFVARARAAAARAPKPALAAGSSADPVMTAGVDVAPPGGARPRPASSAGAVTASPVGVGDSKSGEASLPAAVVDATVATNGAQSQAPPDIRPIPAPDPGPDESDLPVGGRHRAWKRVALWVALAALLAVALIILLLVRRAEGDVSLHRP